MKSTKELIQVAYMRLHQAADKISQMQALPDNYEKEALEMSVSCAQATREGLVALESLERKRK